jgi:hypothetical protein
MSNFDPEALRPMILGRHGDVGEIADEIGADSEELRIFIMNTPTLRRALDEVIARGVDKAVRVLVKGLNDDDHFSNQLAAAKEMLKTRPAQRRGFHHAGDLELKMPSKGGALTLTWLAPEDSRKPEPPLIEGHVESDDG